MFVFMFIFVVFGWFRENGRLQGKQTDFVEEFKHAKDILLESGAVEHNFFLSHFAHNLG